MSLLADLFDTPLREPAECVIRIDGMDIGLLGLHALLREVSVESARGEAATATLTFDNRRDDQGRWDVQDTDLFRPWAKVAIEARFGSHVEPVFSGFVREAQGEYPEDRGAATYTVNCQDDTMALDRNHRRRRWGSDDVPVSDAQVLGEILLDYSIAPHPENAAGTTGMTRLNQDESDIRFLRKRAEANGYELTLYVVPPGVSSLLYFGPMRLSVERQPTIRVHAGSDSHALQIRIREDAQQPDAITVELPTGENGQTRSETLTPDLERLGRESLESTQAGLPPYEWKQSGAAGDDADRIRQQAQMKINDADIHRVVAEGELDGSLYGHVLQVGRPVGLDGVGERHNGVYYVDRVTHTFDGNGYRQQFNLLRNAVGDNL